MATRKYTREALASKYATPFTGMMAGKNIIVNELAKYLSAEGAGEPLFDADTLNDIYTATVTTEKERDMFTRYFYLARWVESNEYSSTTFADTVRALMFYHLEMLSNTIKSEMIEHDMTFYPASAEGDPRFEEKPMSDLASSLLTSTDISRFYEGKPDRFNVTQTWGSICNGLEYCHAYNTAIELIASEIKIPEFKAYRIDLKTLEKLLAVMREHLATLDGIVAAASAGDTYMGMTYTANDIAKRKEVLALLHSLYDAAEEPISEEALASTKKQLHGLSIFKVGTGSSLIEMLLSKK